MKAKKCQCICFSLNSGTAQEKLCSGGLKVERGSVSQRGGKGGMLLRRNLDFNFPWIPENASEIKNWNVYDQRLFFTNIA